MTAEIITKEHQYTTESTAVACLHETELLTKRALVTLSFVERWGMVAGKVNGEDSAGRTKLELSTESEVVDRACKMTDLLFKELKARDWLIIGPTMAELNEKYKGEDVDLA